MALSSGYRSLMGEAAGWVVVAVLGALALTHFGEIRSFLLAAADVPDLQAASKRDGRDAPERPLPAGAVELKAERGGHFFTTAAINGRAIEVMVDTGASLVALTYEDADRAGLFVRATDFTHRVQTANGTARVAPVRIDAITIGDIKVRDVQGVVAERGAMTTTLLGMTFLGRLQSVEMRGGRLILKD